MSPQYQKAVAMGLCLAAAVAVSGPAARADEEELKQRIKQLEQRIDQLEAGKTQQASLPSAEIPVKTLEFLGQTEISGFVSVAYLYDFSKPPSTTSGNEVFLRSFDNKHDEFMLNKFKLAFENPVEANPDH